MGSVCAMSRSPLFDEKRIVSLNVNTKPSFSSVIEREVHVIKLTGKSD